MSKIYYHKCNVCLIDQEDLSLTTKQTSKVSSLEIKKLSLIENHFLNINIKIKSLQTHHKHYITQLITYYIF